MRDVVLALSQVLRPSLLGRNIEFSTIPRYNSGKNGHPVGISTWTLQYLPLTDCLTTYLYLLPIPCVHTPYTTQTEALDLIFRCILHYCCL